MDRNRLIGAGNKMPWGLSLKGDLNQFKQITMGKTLVMGRKTFDSIGRPLPGRETIVLTRDLEKCRRRYADFDIEVMDNIKEVLTYGEQRGVEELIVAGGATIYTAFMKSIQRIYLTEIQADFTGDTYFPKFNPADWILSSEQLHPISENDPYPWFFKVLNRK
jgi:dihydrofolate reductase